MKGESCSVECLVPKSELTSGYHAEYAKDSVGWHSWHTGTVASAIRSEKGIERKVLLSRWIKPVRIIPDSDVASMYQELLSGTSIAVPDNVVSPSLLSELKKIGVNIKESGKVTRNASANNSNKKSNSDIRRSVKDAAPNQYDTSGTHWAIKQGIITKKDLAVFYQSIADLTKRGYYIPETYDGEYIVESDNKMIFTNGDYNFAEIRRVVVFYDTYESNIAEYKRWTIDEARNSSGIGESIELIKDIEGEEYVREYSKELYERDAREAGEREGRNRGADSERVGSEEVKRYSKKDKPAVSAYTERYSTEIETQVQEDRAKARSDAPLTEQFNIDNAENAAYNKNRNGGEQYDSNRVDRGLAEGVPVHRRTDSQDAEAQRIRRGYQGIPRRAVSESLSNAFNESGVVPSELYSFDDDSAAFSSALDAAREADKENGLCVTPKSVDERNGNLVLMDKNGSIGAVVTPDGDIEAVFKNKETNRTRRAMDDVMPQAIAAGGKKLDCYGAGLVKLYERYGFVTVARVAFNEEYVNPGWDASKGKSDIVFGCKNAPTEAYLEITGQEENVDYDTRGTSSEISGSRRESREASLREEQRHERALTFEKSRSKRYRACSDVVRVFITDSIKTAPSTDSTKRTILPPN